MHSSHVYCTLAHAYICTREKFRVLGEHFFLFLLLSEYLSRLAAGNREYREQIHGNIVEGIEEIEAKVEEGQRNGTFGRRDGSGIQISSVQLPVGIDSHQSGVRGRLEEQG